MRKIFLSALLFISVFCNAQDVRFFGTRVDVPPPTPAQLSGTPFGSTEYDPAYTIDKMFDGNVSTFFLSLASTGGYGGLDLGSAKTVTKIRLYPLSGYESRCAALIVEGSNTNSTSGYTTLYTFTGNPTGGMYNDYAISGSYRWVRIRNPSDYVTVTELQVWGY